MSFQKTLFLIFIVNIFLTANVNAGDFDWLEKLSIEAKADGSGFRT